MALEEDQF